MAHVNPDILPPNAGPMPIGGPRHWTRRAGLRLALALAAFAPVVVAVALALVGASPLALALSLGGYLVGAGLSLGLMRRGFPHDSLGMCNLVTLTRLALACALLAPLAGGAAPWAVFAVAALALALDGVDGWLARREGRVSAFGARFDMEVDSALALILALNAWAAGTTGAVVLLIGLPRYVFAAAAWAFPWLDRPVPERFSRKAVCVLQLGTLIALQLPPVAAGLADPVVAVVALALFWSFGRDVLWLWRTRP
jgi:phosphatidylglycerophosphate synthase